MPTLPSRPIDATLSVTKAARLLGVHPNTVRAWSDAGRLRYYRINPRGDRRYRLGDLQRFLAGAAAGATDAPLAGAPPRRRSPDPAARRHRGAIPARDRDQDAAPTASDPTPVPPAVAGAGARVVADLAALATRALGRERLSTDQLLGAAAQTVVDGLGAAACGVWQLDEAAPRLRATAGPGATRPPARPTDRGVLARAIRQPGVAVDPLPVQPIFDRPGPEAAVAIPVGDAPWGVLLLAGPVGDHAIATLPAAARTIGTLVALAAGAADTGARAHRADALRRVAADLAGRLDLGQIASAALDHAVVMFGADRASLALRRPDGSLSMAASRGLSDAWLGVAVEAPPGSPLAIALAELRPVPVVDAAADARLGHARAAVIQEGFDSFVAVPLFVGAEALGVLMLHFDRPRTWRSDELETLSAFASHAAIAVRTARDYGQMATWAAQLQSIQQLGVRLSGLTSVREIGLAIATELRQLIDFHNVRVYRLYGRELVPVAMQGQVGEYVDETPEQLRVAVGEGITGWVAEHKVPQMLPDAATDPRTDTIPGTEDDLDESMLLAPMLFENEVLGVVVLSKLGLRQFTDDDLRLLVIYASFAAQAMANADAHERLRAQAESVERQARSQRELLKITESILTTLDPRAVLEQIADRISALVRYDNISIEVYDRTTRTLRPLTARGIHAEDYLQEWEIGEEGVATWVIEHNEGVLIKDQFDDPRVQHFASTGPLHGGLVVVPLRGRDGVTGVLTVERLGEGNTFTEEEFELVELFAAHVSIALHNAEIHRAVEIQARTDGLTGLLNHGTFRARLTAAVARGDVFGLVMMDLDAFKQVNDLLGHQAGDLLLEEIGHAIVTAGRDTDQVFRYGGDEFAVLLPGADAEAAASVAERIRAAVHGVGRPRSRWEREGIRVSASFGVATFPADGGTAESVLLAADRACFVAKRSGPGRIATADEGLALAAEFTLQEPTPVDSPHEPAA